MQGEKIKNKKKEQKVNGKANSQKTISKRVLESKKEDCQGIG